ncbi:MAG: CvpA family protein [Bacteroidales bacterium]|jgi:membrane protein required for colicin V production|nr:CvpA family protein [Bacteroidales bacterium]
MNWLDIVIALPLCWFGFKGSRHGLVREVTGVLALILGIWATIHFSGYLAAYFGNTLLVRTLAFALTFIIVLALVHLVGMFAEKIIKIIVPSFINHLLGLIFGLSKVVLVCSVLFYFIKMVDHKEKILTRETKTHSLMYKYIEPVFFACKRWVP